MIRVLQVHKKVFICAAKWNIEKYVNSVVFLLLFDCTFCQFYKWLYKIDPNVQDLIFINPVSKEDILKIEIIKKAFLLFGFLIEFSRILIGFSFFPFVRL